MTSIIPALSDKAKLEIAHIQTDRFNPLGSFEAFQDLFDLEKYPITNDTLNEWIISHPHSDISAFDLAPFDELEDFNISIIERIEILSDFFRLPSFIIIGDIHGWWETPQTY